MDSPILIQISSQSPPLPLNTLCLSLLFVVDLCSSTATSPARLHIHFSSQIFLFRLLGSIIYRIIVFYWFCSLDLWIYSLGLQIYSFGFVDLLILFFRNQISVFDLCISIEIKAHHCPPKPDPTLPMAIHSQRRV